jgi:mannan endo-1,4-beta-mannosidase
MIAESGSVEAGGNKAAWLADAATWIKAHPDIAALVWFDTDRSSSRLDWRASSSPSALSAYMTVARDPYFSGHAG